jgi:hypothetical protein
MMEQPYRCIERRREASNGVKRARIVALTTDRCVGIWENFLRAAKILVKTCCINSTISYNYQQVKLAIVDFRSRRINNE